MKKFHLTKGDSSDIGLASSSVGYSAITYSEFHDWLYYVIENTNEVPHYFWDILDIKDRITYLRSKREIFGYFPNARLEEIERKALCGIGYTRFPDYQSDFVAKEEALQALADNPHIAQRFHETFPFIKW
jgi:hypothetical protein